MFSSKPNGVGECFRCELFPDADADIGFDEERDRAKGFRVTSGGRVPVARRMLGQLEGYA